MSGIALESAKTSNAVERSRTASVGLTAALHDDPWPTTILSAGESLQRTVGNQKIDRSFGPSSSHSTAQTPARLLVNHSSRLQTNVFIQRTFERVQRMIGGPEVEEEEKKKKKAPAAAAASSNTQGGYGFSAAMLSAPLPQPAPVPAPAPAAAAASSNTQGGYGFSAAMLSAPPPQPAPVSAPAPAPPPAAAAASSNTQGGYGFSAAMMPPFSANMPAAAQGSSVRNSAPNPWQQGTPPPPAQYAANAKHSKLLKMEDEYKSESQASGQFVLKKVMQKPDLIAFFEDYDKKGRKEALAGLGWNDDDIQQFEMAFGRSRVAYAAEGEERESFKLGLGSPITQGPRQTPFDTRDMYAHGIGEGHAIWVMDPNGVFFAGRHKVGLFHHSSFLAGADPAAAGSMKATQGKLEKVTNKSGHYVPDDDNLRTALKELQQQSVPLSGVKVSVVNDENKLTPEEDAVEFLNRGQTPQQPAPAVKKEEGSN